MELTEKIENQGRKIKEGNPLINLSEACTINNGILKLTEVELNSLQASFKSSQHNLDLCFFTPASGSGSRMFKVFFDYLAEPYPSDAEALSERSIQMLDNIDQLPLRTLLKEKWIKQLEDGGIYPDEMLEDIVSADGLNLPAKPKGLIPFHYYKSKTLNAFQEHLIQSEQIGGDKSRIHFTVNPDFQNEIEHSLSEISTNLAISFSEQDSATNSVAFDSELNPVKNTKGEILMRPSGHGALIKNLNNIDADIILIRNIDNIQHQKKALTSEKYRMALSAKIIEFRDDVFNVLSKLSQDHSFESSIKILNDKYDLKLSTKELNSPTSAFEALNRPIRICGMVKNEGEPGGGPFWVKDAEEKLSRQIIEKSQISDNSVHQEMLRQASHFNPVELFCSVRNYKGEKFDLMNFVDENQYFVVQKTQDGKDIQYIEQPGLWNGAMANWLTLFIEIDSACFSPVKSVLDLLKEQHLG